MNLSELFSSASQSTAGRVADYLLATPLRILITVVVALLLRYLAIRFIDRLVRHGVEGVRLTALRGRARELLREATPGSSIRRQQRFETIGSIMRSTATVVIFGLAFIEILGELGVNLAPIVASAGVIGIAVGFGAQNLVRDFLTGIFMLLEDQYGVGDIIDVGPASGTVESVGLRSTRLRDVNGVVWYVRNGEISRVGNMSQGWSRAVLDISVAYHQSVQHVRTVIKRVADGLWQDPEFAGVVLEEPQVWGVENFGPDSVDIRLVVTTVPLKQWQVARALRERIKEAFDAEGIEIPFPQRSIWVRNAGSDGDLSAPPPAVPPPGS